MKKNRVALMLGVFLLLVAAGCSSAPGAVQEAVEQAAPTLQAVATEAAPAVKAPVEEAVSTGEEADEAASESGEEAVADEEAGEHEVTCAIADVPLPQEADVTLRFTNASGHEMKVLWRDTSQSPAQLVEYALVSAGGTFDQESFAGHEWILEDHERNALEYVVTAEKQQCVTLHHWGYKGETGPEHWAELRDNYETCALGQQQSPIDLTGTGLADLENITFEYGATPVQILNNGHTIQVDKIENNRMVLSSTTYPLLQFHFHAPSEHTVSGKSYPLEMHLVHKLDSGAYAVVGVFIVEGAENSAFAPVWAHLPGEVSGATPTGMSVNVAELLPADHVYYTYNGSLTTPPCGQEVTWLVMKEPVEMSADQIAAFTAIITGNNRPTQPLHDREVKLDETP